MRYKVSSNQGVAIVDAISADDAEEYLQAEYGRVNGPYEAERVADGTETAGIGLTVKIHRTDAFEKVRKEAEK